MAEGQFAQHRLRLLLQVPVATRCRGRGVCTKPSTCYARRAGQDVGQQNTRGMGAVPCARSSRRLLPKSGTRQSSRGCSRVGHGVSAPGARVAACGWPAADREVRFRGPVRRLADRFGGLGQVRHDQRQQMQRGLHPWTMACGLPLKHTLHDMR
eukprot:365949-Chlamydomonas_euryale.AAC.11